MSSWLLKTAIQRGISILPQSHRWNALLQSYVTGGLRIQQFGEFRSKVAASQRHFDYYREYSTDPQEAFTVLEVGTGWFPIIPIGLHLCGASEIWTYDIVRLLRPDTFRIILDHYCQFARSGELRSILSAAREERVAWLVDLASAHRGLGPVEFLERLNIHAIVGDVLQSGLAGGSIDFVFSHGVLEHFPPGPLAEVFAEFRRLCGEASVMSHYIGIADQFAARDKSITPFNYLRYSARLWRWLNNPLIPQNRLRISDYQRACEDAAFQVVSRDDIHGLEQDLAKIQLAPEFRSYSREDLLVLFSWLIARPLSHAPENDAPSGSCEPGYTARAH